MDVLNVPEFRTGLVVGTVATGVLLLVGLGAAVLGRGRPVPFGGVLIAAGGLLTIADKRSVPGAVVVGVIGIGAAAALAYLRSVPISYRLALAVPFAWVIGFHGGVVNLTWVRALVVVAASGGAIVVAEFDHAWRHEAPGLTLFVLTALGVYATVPDTEQVAAVLGVALPFLVLGWPFRLATLGRPGAAAAVATLVWAGAIGGQGRPASMVGAVVCLGLLMGVPVGRALLPETGALLQRVPRNLVMVALVVSHLVIVVVASRVAGRLSATFEAAVIGTGTGVAAVVVGAVFRPAGSSAVASTRVD